MHYLRFHIWISYSSVMVFTKLGLTSFSLKSIGLIKTSTIPYWTKIIADSAAVIILVLNLNSLHLRNGQCSLNIFVSKSLTFQYIRRSKNIIYHFFVPSIWTYFSNFCLYSCVSSLNFDELRFYFITALRTHFLWLNNRWKFTRFIWIEFHSALIERRNYGWVRILSNGVFVWFDFLTL